MRTKKYYQYKYLLEKINHQFTNNQLHEETTEHWDNLGTGMSSEQRDYADEQSIKMHTRTTHLNDWLNKINNKYKYKEQSKNKINLRLP